MSATGIVRGIAADRQGDDPLISASIVDQNNNKELVGEGFANLSLLINNELTEDGFAIQIPENLIDNQAHRVQGYVLEGEEEFPLDGNIGIYGL